MPIFTVEFHSKPKEAVRADGVSWEKDIVRFYLLQPGRTQQSIVWFDRREVFKVEKRDIIGEDEKGEGPPSSGVSHERAEQKFTNGLHTYVAFTDLRDSKLPAGIYRTSQDLPLSYMECAQLEVCLACGDVRRREEV